VNVSDLSQRGRGLRDLLGLLDDLLGVGLDLLLLLFNNFGQLLDSLLERFLSLGDLLFLSHLDLLVDLSGSLRGNSDLGVLGLLLDLDGFLFELLDGILQVDDLSVDGGIFTLEPLELAGLTLDGGLDGADFGGESSDFIFVLCLKVLRFGADDFLLKLRNFLLLGRDSSGLCLDGTLGLHDFVSDDRSLSSVFFSLRGDLLLGLLGGMLVSNSILLNANGSLLVSVVVVSSANSVDAASLNLLVLLLGVV